MENIEKIPILLSAGDVGKIFSIEPSTVYQWKARGILKGVKVGRTLRFRTEDVKELIYSGTRQPVCNDNSIGGQND